MDKIFSLWAQFFSQDRITVRPTPELGPGQMGLFSRVDLVPGQCHLRFANVTVDSQELQKYLDSGIISQLSIMDETRKYKSLALGPARLLNHHCLEQSMEWSSELHDDEFQSLFTSHVYATVKIPAGSQVFANYGERYFEDFGLCAPFMTIRVRH